MVNRPRAKGTTAESAVVKYLSENGFPYAERRALTGSTDLGDITGTPGIVWEVKYANGGIRMGEWVGETYTEKANARADHAVLVIKPFRMGVTKVDKWFAVMLRGDLTSLTNKIPASLVQMSDPEAYGRDELPTKLSDFAASVGGSWVPMLTARPPGMKDNPESWYQVTYLDKIVPLLRSAGYGTPL